MKAKDIKDRRKAIKGSISNAIHILNNLIADFKEVFAQATARQMMAN
jgi:hypothetical protein